MNIHVGVLTFETEKYNRVGLLNKCLSSLLKEEANVTVWDNSPLNGYKPRYPRYNVEAEWRWLENLDGVNTCGRGMNSVFANIYNTHPETDVVVFSNDDMEWKPGWREKLISFWEAAPKELIILSGMVCNEYEWNTTLRPLNVGGLGIVLRRSATGGAWTMRRSSIPLVLPISEAPNDDDVRKCHELLVDGYYVAEADLAEHKGAEASTWGNQGWTYGTPLDFKALGLR